MILNIGHKLNMIIFDFICKIYIFSQGSILSPVN